MPRPMRSRRSATPAMIIGAYLDERRQELLDVLATAAALVAHADGEGAPVECGQLADFLDRQDLLSEFSRAEIREAFERHGHALKQPGGLAAALRRVRSHAGHPLGRVLIEIGEEVADADCRLDPREQHVLQLMRSTLRAAS